ncbi:MAG: hypothetical protein Q9159_005128 [Coniocarpon cinnabarinum]
MDSQRPTTTSPHALRRGLRETSLVQGANSDLSAANILFELANSRALTSPTSQYCERIIGPDATHGPQPILDLQNPPVRAPYSIEVLSRVCSRLLEGTAALLRRYGAYDEEEEVRRRVRAARTHLSSQPRSQIESIRPPGSSDSTISAAATELECVETIAHARARSLSSGSTPVDQPAPLPRGVGPRVPAPVEPSIISADFGENVGEEEEEERVEQRWMGDPRQRTSYVRGRR